MPNDPEAFAIASDDPAATDEALRLVGLFFVNFSRLVQHLEVSINWMMRPASAQGNVTTWTLTGQLSASQLWQAWLAATAEWHPPDQQEQRIRTALGKRVTSLLEARNDLAHGAWSLVSTTGVEIDGELIQQRSFEPSVSRTKTSKAGTEMRKVLESRVQLQELATEAREVGSLIWEYWTGTLRVGGPAMPRVADRLGFDANGRLVQLDLTDWFAPAPPDAV